MQRPIYAGFMQRNKSFFYEQDGEHPAHFGVTKPSNPKDRAATSRLDLSLFPDSAAAYGALAFSEGDLKYGGYNYRDCGVSANVYVAACRRHLAKWYNGEEEDPTTNIPHLASALACIAVIIEGVELGNLKDDRPPKMDMGDLLNRCEGKVKHLQSIFTGTSHRFTEIEDGDSK